MPLAQLSASFQLLPLLHTRKLGLSGDDSCVGGLVYILKPCKSLQWTLLWGWECLLLPQSPQEFSIRGLRLYFPMLESWVAKSYLLPSCYSWFIHTQMWDCQLCQTSPRCVCQTPPCPPSSSSRHLAMRPLHPGCLSPYLLLVWMNVSSLTPWLLDFHTIRFSGSSGFFPILSLSSFWLCEEAKCIYLCLYLGWK